MAAKRKIKLSNLSGVAASGTTVLEVPLAFGRCHYILLEHGYSSGTNTVAAAATNISEIRVVVNGTVVRTISGTQLRDMNIANGTAYDCLGVPNTSPGVSFPIFFAEPWRKDAKDQDALAWPSAAMNSFKIEVALGAASTPTLVAHAVVDDVQGSADALICKWIRQPFNAGSTSFDISTIDRRGWLTQISLYPDSGASNAATRVTVKKDGIIVHELSKSANLALLTNHAMTPAASGRTANIYDVVFDHDDLLGSALQMAGSKDLVVTVEAGSTMSGTVTGIIQRLEKFD